MLPRFATEYCSIITAANENVSGMQVVERRVKGAFFLLLAIETSNMTGDVVRLLLRELASGDAQAAQTLWNRYFTKLTKVAWKHLNGLPLRVADEEDVALSAVRSVQHGLGDGRYSDLKGPENL